MKINRFFGIASLSLVLSSSGLSAQYYYPVALSGGFNGDAIANGVGPAASSTTIPIDNGSSTTENNAYLSKDYQPTAASPVLTFGLPITGQFWGAVTTTQGLTYQLAPYTGQNTLKLSATGDTGTLSFTTATAANSLYLLTTGGGGAGVLSAIVNFSDGTTQSFTNLAVADWYGGTGFAIQGIGRVKIDTDVVDAAGGTNPRMYQIPMAIDAANQSKTITSVAITKTSGSGLLSVFAISADKYSSCVAPTAITASAIAATSATVSWTAPSTPPSNYDVYYTSATVAPSSTAAPSVAGVTGITTSIGALVPNIQYYVWVRSNCGATTGEWAYGTNFKSACGAVTSLSENFDAYAAVAVLPDCWGRLVTTGTLSISSTSPASGSRNVYQTSSTSQVPTTAVLPELSNINAGTHWLKFKARVSAATGTLNVGYVTNATDPSTFVLLKSLSIANTTYITNFDYGVVIPSTIPANARLAIRNTADGKGYYWDDVVWEPTPSCLPPSDIVLTNASPNSVDVSWTAPSTGAASGYEYFYTPVSTFVPNASTVASGTLPANSVSGIISGLNPNHSYDLFMRSVCSNTDKSTWTYKASFKTTCGLTPSLFEDFESYGSSVSIVPNCWARIITTNGTQQISATSPASGVRNVYQYSTTSQNPTVVVLPEFSNVSAGTHRLRFKARTGAATGTLNVGYVTSTTDATTFVNIQTLSLANTSYASGAEYTVDVPNTVPANARLAIKNTADSKSYYWDDVVWEDKNALSTIETPVKKKLSIHPNPFKDVLFISETKDIKSVMIYDVAGRVVKLVNDSSKEIRVSDLKEGMYLVKVNFKDGSQSVTKAIKK